MITPPPELVQQWASEFYGTSIAPGEASIAIANQAARWGADQQLKLDAEQIAQAYTAGADAELVACCEWVSQWRCMVGGNRPEVGLRAARRPKPPSLKEQALQHVGLIQDNWARLGDGLEAPPSLTGQITLKQLEDIRRALEALPTD